MWRRAHEWKGHRRYPQHFYSSCDINSLRSITKLVILDDATVSIQTGPSDKTCIVEVWMGMGISIPMGSRGIPMGMRVVSDY